MKVSAMRFAALVLCLIGVAGSTNATEHESRILTDRWYFSLGTSASSFSTEASIGFGSVVGSFIRLEDDLALEDDSDSFRFNGIFAIKPKHAIDLSFTDFSRDGRIVIDKSFTIGDDGDEVVFEVGADVATSFDSTNVKLFYKYSFVNTGKTQAGIGAGLSLFDYTFRFDGEATQGSGMFQITRVDESILAPIPSFLMFINHAFTPKLILRMHAGYFDLDIDDIEGSLLETRITLDYFIIKWFALGFGAEGSTIDFKDRSEDPLTIEVQNRSWIFYVAGAF
jgi:hypothetical protein